jgi:hypothetical protein
MADVLSRVETVTNAGATQATFGANFGKHSLSQSDVGRELIISVTKSGSGNITDTLLTAVRNQLTLAGGSGSGDDVNGPDAFTIGAVGTADGSAFVSGTTTVVFLRVQGTGTPNLTAVDSSTLAQVCEFEPRL